MRVFVVNLERRPDRRDQMLQLAREIGFSVDIVSAVDGRNFGSALDGIVVRPTLVGRISDGDLACTLSHRKIWQLIADGPDPYGVVLEDDVRLSHAAARFFGDTSWIPADAKVVKIERYGRRYREIALDAQALPALDRTVRRFYTRNIGGAGYILSRTAAKELVSLTTTISVPVDQILFNPVAADTFKLLKPYVLEPALCEQDNSVFVSDIRPKAKRSFRTRLRSAIIETSTLRRAIAQRFSIFVRKLRGEIVMERLTFRD